MSTDLQRVQRATRKQARARLAAGGVMATSTRGGLRPAQSWAFLTGEPYGTGYGAMATEAEAMGLPPFGRGVALLANAVAGTAWRAMRWDAEQGVPVRVVDEPMVLTDPDPTTDPWQYKWAAVEDLVLYGNHFALYGDVDFRTLRPGWLMPLPADDVWLLIDPETNRWAFTVGGVLRDADELLHVSAGNRSGDALGRGVLAQYGVWLGGSVAAEEHAGNYFAGGAMPPAVLQAPVVLTQGQADELKAKWRTMTNTREPVVLPSGYVLTPVVTDADKAQLVESRQWNAAAVAMMLGIPSYKLGLAGPSMTYQNIESADIEFVRDSVDRYARPLSEAFSKWLMPRGTSVQWDYAGRMRADASTTAAVVGSLVSSGLLTIDEGRAMIGRGPLPETPSDSEGDTPDQDEQPPEQPEQTGDLTPQEVA
jgi:HK97 family phage portal protein